MRKSVFTMLILPLLVASTFAGWNSIPIVNALPDVYQGNLVLNGNNVTTISGRFDINGSIVVEENATLILKNAVINFTESTSRQYNLTLQNPVNGSPHLLAFNSTIDSSNPAFDILTYVKANSTAEINNSTISSYIMALDTGHLIISNSSKVDVQYGYSSSHIEVYNSTIREWHNYYSPEVEVENSTVNGLVIGSYSVNCTIHGLKSGFFKYWNFITNCSVVYLAGGASPNVTLTNSTINNWRLAFYQASNAFITDSDVGEISAIAGSSSINIRSTQSDYLYADNLATLQADNSTIGTLTTYETAQVSIVHSSVNSLQAHGSSAVWFNTTSVSTVECSDSSKSWLLNSTYSSLIFHDSGTAYIAWYLTVHILDMISQDVPSANITAIFENSTTATTAKTNINGTVTLALAEKAINITGEYSFANYTVTAAYDTYTNQTWVNMTANQQATLVLGFILPEFQSLIMVFALMTATILIVTFNTKRRRKLT